MGCTSSPEKFYMISSFLNKISAVSTLSFYYFWNSFWTLYIRDAHLAVTNDKCPRKSSWYVSQCAESIPSHFIDCLGEHTTYTSHAVALGGENKNKKKTTMSRGLASKEVMNSWKAFKAVSNWTWILLKLDISTDLMRRRCTVMCKTFALFPAEACLCWERTLVESVLSTYGFESDSAFPADNWSERQTLSSIVYSFLFSLLRSSFLFWFCFSLSPFIPLPISPAQGSQPA